MNFVVPRWLRRVLRTASTTALMLGAVASAHAQWRPSGPVTLVVPYAAGGGTDITARALAQQLSVRWSQPVNVLNVTGADGLIGSQRVVESKPDGQTLLLQIAGIALTPHVPGTKGVHLLDKLEPISNVAESLGTISVNANLPVRSVRELLNYCRTAPQPCSFATGDNMTRLSARYIAKAEKLDNLINPNYRGSGAVMPDLLAGNVTAAIVGFTSALPQHRAGKIRILAVTSKKRSQTLPEVPGLAEEGYPDYARPSWLGLFAPKGTPREIRNEIANAVVEVMKQPQTRASLIAAGVEPAGNLPDQFAAEVEAEQKALVDLVKQFPLD